MHEAKRQGRGQGVLFDQAMRERVTRSRLLEQAPGGAVAGRQLAMDNFGTGTSSLACLRDYPFHCIKIDRSLVTDLCQDPRLLAEARATVQVIEPLGMHRVAEGVEHAAQADSLRPRGCRLAQGGLFALAQSPGQLLAAWPPPG